MLPGSAAGQESSQERVFAVVVLVVAIGDGGGGFRVLVVRGLGKRTVLQVVCGGKRVGEENCIAGCVWW